MGSLAVLAMAEDASSNDATPRRPVHPFFAQNHNRSHVPAVDKPTLENASVSSDASASPHNTAASDKSEEDAREGASNRPSRRRKADKDLNVEEDEKKTRPRKRTRHSAGGGIENHFVRLGNGTGSAVAEPDGIDGLVRGTSAQGDGLSSNTVKQADPGTDIAPTKSLVAESSADDQVESTDRVSKPAAVPPAAEGSTPARPKKLLQFNPRTGTIGSPPKPKEPKVIEAETGGDGEKKRRGRERASKIARIIYGTDSKCRIRIGERINAIINSRALSLTATSARPAPLSANTPSPAASKPATSKSSKGTHPFFLGQTKKADPVPPDSKPSKPNSSPATARTKQYTSTPCSPRRPRARLAATMPMPQFGIKNAGLKFPGAKLPAWPWQGMMHVRGDEFEAAATDGQSLSLPSRKSKGHAVGVSHADSILNIVAQTMEIPAIAEAVRNINTDVAIPPPPELRLPQRHFESGSKLRARVIPELRTFQHSSPGRKPAQRKQPLEGNGTGIQAPRQLVRLFDSVATSLSAFERFQCETTNWTQKYAPASAAEVLQPGAEAFLLKDWLQALTVQSVDTGSSETEKQKAGSKAKGAGAGKKKRRKKLDGFIVSSEDEDYELNEPSDEEDNWAPSGVRGIARKTVVRSRNLKGKDADKTANTLVISGPHGCGKTAAVYAVAKELDFEVFEINSSSRRSGRDVLEKIGDMTRNHHVQQHQTASTPDLQEAAAEDEIAQDIKSGKQSTMNAFFKPKSGTAKSGGAKPKQPAKPAAQIQQTDSKKDTPKTQRQSLILLEEVDVLYEEDKQFWTTIVGLIAQAKRPFIMTCTDEALVPLHTLRLHGIFRLSTPPRDLAIDRLILIAANEGHALTRQAVESLYDSRSCDLRAATMDLQYWCQIGVGDRRGGFDWFYPRWPKGIDLDENNEVVRVISQGTFLPGMNLLGRDSIVDPKTPPRLVEEELLNQARELWGLDVGHWQDSVGLGPWAQSLEMAAATPAGRLEVLAAYDDLAEAMSAADIASCKSFAAFKEEAIDATHPEPPAKIRDDFVLGLTHLDTPYMTHHTSLTTSVASTLKSFARCSLRERTKRVQGASDTALLPLDEAKAIDYIQTSFKSAPPWAPVLNRIDFAFAFDPIATADTSPPQPASYLEPSVFDRTLKLITLDVAPYVRAIVAYESHLQKQRLKLSNLVSEGGGGSKRMRTTRSALSALEGGSRSTTRGERWFKADLNPYLVANTAGEGWSDFDSAGCETPDRSSKTSPKTSPDTSPAKTPKKVSLKGRKRKMIVQDDDVDELS
ncbi:AAA+ ATPase domain-containing protein [Madurella fahalii]|uniref:AAA+ ATPase domain-containing protein n=1 Tax=Madurella fahalii TaxID=1157608 RepID=A0ABQ0GT20_9PEZI